MVGVRPPLYTVQGIGPGGPENLVPSAIIQADIHLTAVVPLGDASGLLTQVPELLGQRREVPEKLHLHLVPFHLSDGLQQVLLQQAHDGAHLILRPLPVFRGKGIDRQILQADLLAVGGDGAESLRPGGMSRRTGQPPLFGPPAISIHDNGDMPGQVLKVNLYLRLRLLCKQRHI